MLLRVDPAAPSRDDLARAVAWLREGGIVALPTDTLYGLAVDPTSDHAVRRLFQLKGREASAALPLVAASRAQVERWCGLSAVSHRLADVFWPGPLSLVCDAPPQVVPAVHGGRRTVAIRVPAHGVAQALAQAWGAPLTATSANRSGDPPARTAAEVVAWAGETVLVLDGGDVPGGLPSTIVDARAMPPRLVREGAVPWDRVLHSLER